MNLETVSRYFQHLVLIKCGDVVGIDLSEDFVRPISRRYYQRRLMPVDVLKLTEFLNNRLVMYLYLVYIPLSNNFYMFQIHVP